MKSQVQLKAIGINIRKARIDSGIKGEVLAKDLGKTKAYISQVENGLIDLKVSTLVEICRVLNIEFCGMLCAQSFHSTKEFEDSHTKAVKVVVDREVIESLIAEISTIKKELHTMKAKDT